MIFVCLLALHLLKTLAAFHASIQHFIVSAVHYRNTNNIAQTFAQLRAGSLFLPFLPCEGSQGVLSQLLPYCREELEAALHSALTKRIQFTLKYSPFDFRCRYVREMTDEDVDMHSTNY